MNTPNLYYRNQDNVTKEVVVVLFLIMVVLFDSCLTTETVLCQSRRHCFGSYIDCERMVYLSIHIL